MTIRTHVQIVGALLLMLGLAHAFFPRYFGWAKELAPLSLLTRRIFQVHSFFIALVVVLLGACSLFYADTLLQSTPLSRIFLAGIVLFWVCRLFVQFFVYDSTIWRGNRLYTSMHIAFSMLWIYVVVTYALALRTVTLG